MSIKIGDKEFDNPTDALFWAEDHGVKLTCQNCGNQAEASEFGADKQGRLLCLPCVFELENRMRQEKGE